MHFLQISRVQKLTFLLAALHARHAVEFFLGLLTAIDDCGATTRGGPGASGAKDLEALWWLIFCAKK